MKRLFVLIALLLTVFPASAGGDLGQPINLHVTLTLSPYLVSTYNPLPTDISQVPEVQNVINALALDGGGLVSITGNRTPSGGVIVYIEWRKFLLSSPTVNLQATQQALVALENKHVSITASLDVVLLD